VRGGVKKEAVRQVSRGRRGREVGCSALALLVSSGSSFAESSGPPEAFVGLSAEPGRDDWPCNVNVHLSIYVYIYVYTNIYTYRMYIYVCIYI